MKRRKETVESGKPRKRVRKSESGESISAEQNIKCPLDLPDYVESFGQLCSRLRQNIEFVKERLEKGEVKGVFFLHMYAMEALHYRSNVCSCCKRTSATVDSPQISMSCLLLLVEREESQSVITLYERIKAKTHCCTLYQPISQASSTRFVYTPAVIETRTAGVGSGKQLGCADWCWTVAMALTWRLIVYLSCSFMHFFVVWHVIRMLRICDKMAWQWCLPLQACNVQLQV